MPSIASPRNPSLLPRTSRPLLFQASRNHKLMFYRRFWGILFPRTSSGNRRSHLPFPQRPSGHFTPTPIRSPLCPLMHWIPSELISLCLMSLLVPKGNWKLGISSSYQNRICFSLQFFFLFLFFKSMGNCRWELPSQESSVLASTANEMRKDRYTPINPEKLKAAAEGLTQSRFSFFPFLL